MNHDFKTIYDIVDQFRRRPALYVGNSFAREPFATFLAFLCGLGFSDIDPGTPSIWGFTRWITARVRGISTNLPCDWLHEKYGTKGALEVYLRHLDEYRNCEETEIASMDPVNLVPGFSLMDAEGKTQRPPHPTRLFIGQFSPSKVFFLGEEYGGHAERSFPYHRTEKGVIDEATSKWGASVSAWQRQRTKRST